MCTPQRGVFKSSTPGKFYEGCRKGISPQRDGMGIASQTAGRRLRISVIRVIGVTLLENVHSVDGFP
jgi:hypothetical protein